MVTAKGVASYGLRGKWRKVQCVCEDGCEAGPTTTVEEVYRACEGVEAKRINAILFERNTDVEAILLEARAVKSTMHE